MECQVQAWEAEEGDSREVAVVGSAHAPLFIFIYYLLFYILYFIFYILFLLFILILFCNYGFGYFEK
jgi:hypothetical protein